MNDPLDQFAPLLDAERMLVALRQRLPECATGDWQLTGCEIQHPRYKTYRNPENRERSCLSLVYHLRGERPSSAAVEQRILYARAYLGERSQQAFEAAQATVRPDGRQSVLHFSDLGMVGFRFPDDPAMPWLAELMDVGRVARLVPGAEGACAAAPLMSVEVVNYRPEIRCTARYRFRSSAASPESVLYGKIYSDGRGLQIHENLSALHRQSQATRGFVVPKALGYDVARHVLWLEALHGVPLKDRLFPACHTDLLDAVGKGLASLQQMSLPHGEVVTLAQLLQEWSKKADKLAQAFPDLGDSLRDLVAELQRRRLESGGLGLIHGDFHVDQLAIRDDGRLALFDFDELAFGDPLQDLANFAADLYGYPQVTDETDRLVERLFAAYCRAAPSMAEPDRFAWHLRGQLLTRAYRAHIQQKAETERQVTRLVALALRPWPVAD